MDENQEVIQEQVEQQPEQQQQQEPQYTELEQQAMDQGWMPKEKWVESGKPEGEHRSAKEFIDRTDLYKRIEHLNRDNKDLRKAMTDLMEHNKRMDQVAYNRAMDSLRSAKKQALEDGDADRVVEIDDQLLDLKTAQRQAPAQQQPAQEIHPEFKDWVDRNTWYNKNAELRSDADTAGIAFKRNNPHASPAEVLDYVEKFIRKANPEMFQTKKAAPPSPESSDRSANKPSPKASVSLTEDESRAMKRFVRMGVMTEDEYKNQIKEMRTRGV